MVEAAISSYTGSIASMNATVGLMSLGAMALIVVRWFMAAMPKDETGKNFYRGSSYLFLGLMLLLGGHGLHRMFWSVQRSLEQLDKYAGDLFKYSYDWATLGFMGMQLLGIMYLLMVVTHDGSEYKHQFELPPGWTIGMVVACYAITSFVL